MSRTLIAVALLLLVPATASASVLTMKRTLVLSEPPSENAYLVGTDITVVAPLVADIAAIGATLSLGSTVAGDAFLLGGTLDTKGAIAGDLRAIGGRIIVEEGAGGDLFLAGNTVTVTSSNARDTRIIAGTIRLEGAEGPVELYGANVHLSGEINGDVRVVASDTLTLAEDTHITGTLAYNAPQQALVPASALVDGGVEYTGRSSYLPTIEEAQRFAVAGAGVFFVAQVIAVLVAAGLLAGLFPVFANRIADKVLTRSFRRFVLFALLGFGVTVAAPVLIMFLLVSVVGVVLALLLTLVYLLLLMLGYLYAGVLAGAALWRGLLKRRSVSWQSAVIGMLTLYLIGVVPVIGMLVILVLGAAAIGAILMTAYRFVFGRDESLDAELNA